MTDVEAIRDRLADALDMDLAADVDKRKIALFTVGEVETLLDRLEEVEERLGEFLWNMTGGLLSKPNYTMTAMTSAADEVVQRQIREAVREAKAEAEAAVERARALAESWRYKGEFGWGPWQEGHGPDPEGHVLDYAASMLRRTLDGEASDG